MMSGGLTALITSLWRRGVPVVGWAALEPGVALLVEGGTMTLVPRARLGERVDLVADDLVTHLPRRSVFETPADPQQVPQFTAREIAWLQFLCWLCQRAAEPDDRGPAHEPIGDERGAQDPGSTARPVAGGTTPSLEFSPPGSA
jgi:hypothetical protein